MRKDVYNLYNSFRKRERFSWTKKLRIFLISLKKWLEHVLGF